MKNVLKKCSFYIIFLLQQFLNPVMAQDVIIKGNVTNDKGLAVNQASINIKNNSKGAVSDSAGNFSIRASLGQVLVISALNHSSKEIVVKDQAYLNITITSNQKDLGEVVVVGYGTQRKKDLTGAISTLSGEIFNQRKETQVSQALQGAISGVMVTRSGSNGAMGTATIRIRGITTIGDSNPLVLVDGVPVDDVNGVSPNDIENISVLKDAASASIYGSRAASGVILITTKRAKTNQLSIQYSYENGVDISTKLPSRLGSIDFMNKTNELRWNDAGNGANQYPTFTKAYVDAYAANNLANPNLYPNTDWIGMMLKTAAPRQSHLVNITAGTQAIKSNFSVRYEKIGGFWDNKDYSRIFARSNNDFTINKFISGAVDLNLKRTINTSAQYNPLSDLIIAPAIYPAVWTDGRVADGKAGSNVYARIKYGGTDLSTFNQLSGRVQLDIKPLNGLKISGIFSPIFNFNKQKTFNQQVKAYSATDPTQFLTFIEGCTTTKLIEQRSESYSLNSQLLINYSKSFNSHDFSAFVGYEDFYNFSESLSASRDQFLFDSYPYLDQGPVTFRDNGGSAFETAYKSAFGRVTYGFKGKYLLQANVRYDGSSRFNADYRWGTFPSISAGWVISEEGFMPKNNFLSFLKLRASWGALGNERIGNYPYVGSMSFSNALFYQNNIAVSQQTAAQVQYAIKDISWEKTESTDIGVDANFFKNRMRFTADVYSKKTIDMLLPLQIPLYVGFTNPNQNTGIMTTKGIDIDLGWTDKIGKLNYSVSANLSQFTSVMGDLGGTEFLGDQIKKLGSEFNEWYGYISEGIYQDQIDVNTSAKLSPNVKVGDMKYRDISGPNGVPDGLISPDYDRVYLGSSQPQWMYGGNIRLEYSGFDLGISFQGIGYQKRDMRTYTDYNNANYGTFFPEVIGNTWSAYNTTEQNLGMKYPRLTETNKGFNRSMSSFWLFNGGYFRLKNLTIGYNVSKNIAKKISANSIRLYVSGSDLFTVNKFPTGFDPEGLGIVSTIIGGFTIGF